MKSCDEVIKSVMERSSEIRRVRAKRIERIKLLSGSAAICLALIGTIGISLWRSSHDGVITITSEADPYQGITEQTSSETSDEKGDNPQNTSESNELKLCPMHPSFSGYDKIGDDYDNIIVEKNMVYISEDLLRCMNENLYVYTDGCCQLYQVRAVYFKDGERLAVDSDFVDSECKRTESFVKETFEEMFDRIKCPTGVINSFTTDAAGKKEYFYEAVITRSQIENFPPLEDYGIALYLSGNYCEWLNENLD